MQSIFVVKSARCPRSYLIHFAFLLCPKSPEIWGQSPWQRRQTLWGCRPSNRPHQHQETNYRQALSKSCHTYDCQRSEEGPEFSRKMQGVGEWDLRKSEELSTIGRAVWGAELGWHPEMMRSPWRLKGRIGGKPFHDLRLVVWSASVIPTTLLPVNSWFQQQFPGASLFILPLR